MKTCLSTLCYLERDRQYLMLHRVKKAHDINHGKWIGVGGHFEEGESPEECLVREVAEETGYTLTDFSFRGIVTFVYGEVVEYMHLFTAKGFTGTLTDCDEGTLSWVPKTEVLDLNLWEGDRIFLQLLMKDAPFFSLKLVYDEADRLVTTLLNGKEL